MNHATENDLRMIEGLITGVEGTVTIRMELAAALVDEIRKHRGHHATVERTAGMFECSTIISSRTKEGMVNVYMDGHHMQLDLSKAREVRSILDGAIEAAISDQLIFMFLTQKVGLSEQQIGAALLDFRELRQGSRSTVLEQ